MPKMIGGTVFLFKHVPATATATEKVVLEVPPPANYPPQNPTHITVYVNDGITESDAFAAILAEYLKLATTATATTELLGRTTQGLVRVEAFQQIPVRTPLPPVT